MKPADKYTRNGKNGIATILAIEPSNRKGRNNGQAVIYQYEGGHQLRMGKATFLQCHRELV